MEIADVSIYLLLA